MTFLAEQADDAIPAASKGGHCGRAISVEPDISKVSNAVTSVEDVDAAEKETSNTAEIAPRPWRPRGVRAGRRLKKRYGVSAGIG